MFRLACEGDPPSLIAKVMGLSIPGVQYWLDVLVGEDILVRARTGRPVLYKPTGRPLKLPPHGDGGRDLRETSHHNIVMFYGTGPPARVEGVDWDKEWKAGTTRFWNLKDKSIPTLWGPVDIKELRLAVGPHTQSIRTYLGDDDHKSPGDLETQPSRLCDRGLWVAKWIGPLIEMPINLMPYIVSDGHHVIGNLWFDQSHPPYAETDNFDIARLLKDPRAFIQEVLTYGLLQEGLIPLTDKDEDGKT